MGQGTEVARRADGAADRHERNDALVQHGLDEAHHLGTDARVAPEEGVQPDAEGCTHHLGGEVVGRVVGLAALAHAHGMAEKDVPLQELEPLRWNGNALELAEARGDPVGEGGTILRRLGAFEGLEALRVSPHDALDLRPASAHPLHGLVAAADSDPGITGDADEIFDGQGCPVEQDGIGSAAAHGSLLLGCV